MTVGVQGLMLCGRRASDSHSRCVEVLEDSNNRTRLIVWASCLLGVLCLLKTTSRQQTAQTSCTHHKHSYAVGRRARTQTCSRYFAGNNLVGISMSCSCFRVSWASVSRITFRMVSVLAQRCQVTKSKYACLPRHHPLLDQVTHTIVNLHIRCKFHGRIDYKSRHTNPQPF